MIIIITLILQMRKVKCKRVNKLPEITQLLNGRAWTVFFQSPYSYPEGFAASP